MHPVEHLVAFGVLLALAAGCDVFRRRVPNPIIVALLLGGLASHVATDGWRAAAAAAAVALMIGALLVVPWSIRIIGGGDLKLVAATAAWMGPGRIGAFVLATALVGGVLAVPFLRGLRATRDELLVAAAQARVAGPGAGAPIRARRVPLAVAIALGAAAAVAMG